MRFQKVSVSRGGGNRVTFPVPTFLSFFLSFIGFTPSKRQEQKRLVLISAIVGQGGRGNGLKVNWLSC